MMPYKLKCTEAVTRQYLDSPREVQDAFFRVYQEISRDPTAGEPFLMVHVPGSTNIRRIRFEHGTITFRYKYHADDAEPQVYVLAWTPKKGESL